MGRPYDTAEYRRNRKIILEQSNYICHYCTGPATTADHIVPVSQGGTNELSNLLPACHNCSTIWGKYGLLDKWFGVFLYIYRQPRPHLKPKYTNQIMKNHISTIWGKYGLLDKWFGVFLYIYRQPRPQCQ